MSHTAWYQWQAVNKSMDNLVHESELISDIAGRAGSATSVDDLFDGVADLIVQIFDVECAAICLPDPHEPYLEVRKSVGLSAESQATMWSFDDESIIPTIHRSGRTFFGNGISSDPRIPEQDAVRAWNLHSMLAAPIIAQKQVIGVLVVARQSAAAFQELQLSALKAVAAQIGLAIGQIEVHERLHKQSLLMEQVNQIGSHLSTLVDPDALFEQVVTMIHRDLRCEAVSLWLREGEDVVLRARAVDSQVTLTDSLERHPISKGIVGRAVRTAHSFVTRDLTQDADFMPSDTLRHLRSALTVPIRSGEHVIGALIVLSSEIGHFDTIDRLAMETLAAQVAISTENARLYRETQQRLAEQRLILEIGAELSAVFDFSTLVDLIVFHLAQALEVSSCILALYDPEVNSLVYQGHYTSQSAVDRDALKKVLPTYPLNQMPVTRQVIHMGAPIALHSGDPDIPEQAQTLLSALGQESALLVQLAAGGQALGMLVCAEDRYHREFTEADIRLAQTLANQAAVVLDHTRLHEETRRQLQRETVLRRVAETANTWTDQATLFGQYAKEVNRALRTSVCTIYMMDETGNLVPQTRQTATGVGEVVHEAGVLAIDAYPSLKAALLDGAVFSVSLGNTALTLPEQIRIRELGFTGMLTAPLIYRDILVGAVEVLDWRVGYRFTVDDITMIEALAHQLSTAAQSYVLYQEEQRQRALLERIQQTSQAIASELREEPLLDLVVERVSQVFEVDAAAIVLPHEDGEFHIVASTGLSESFIESFKISENRLRELHGGNEPGGTVFEDVREVSKVQLDLVSSENLRTIMSIPLTHAHELVGSLAVMTRGEERTFTRHEFEMAQLLGRQIAIAINNARLFELQEERAAELAMANRLKNEFLANISHELRTPMNSIIGFSEGLLAGMHGELAEKQHSRLDVVVRNAHQLLKLIDDLIDLSNLEAGRMELAYSAFDPAELLMSLEIEYGPKAKEKGLDFSCEFEQSLPRLWSDIRRVRQVFHNLLSNAIKFTEKGSVKVKAGAGNREDSPMVKFTISDTGIGIAPEDRDIIFDAFRQVDGSSTRKYEGTGMGLTITHRLVQLMGGTIEIESEVGKGTVFHLTFPGKTQEQK